MKFLVDAQLPPALAAWLRARGHVAASVREVGLREADDRSIWSLAEREATIIVTKDEDFAFLAATATGTRVLWVRTGNVVNRQLLAQFERAWIRIADSFEAGAQIVELR
ncbi:MAG TPA: DUF5615 family PIN-like protein [Rhizomicrobium sp.]